MVICKITLIPDKFQFTIPYVATMESEWFFFRWISTDCEHNSLIQLSICQCRKYGVISRIFSPFRFWAMQRENFYRWFRTKANSWTHRCCCFVSNDNSKFQFKYFTTNLVHNPLSPLGLTIHIYMRWNISEKQLLQKLCRRWSRSNNECTHKNKIVQIR